MATLVFAIQKSLQLNDVHPDLPPALLTPDQTKANNRSEGKYWDYKETIHPNTPRGVAELARDVAAFHNTEGGLIAVGIRDDFVVKGLNANEIVQTAQLNQKLRSYLGRHFTLFSTSLTLSQNKFLWLIFIPKAKVPVSMQRNGPEIGPGKTLFVRGDFYYRDGDETKRCLDELDIDRVFRGLLSDSLTAYNFEVDEPFFRLLSPNYDDFFGRLNLKQELKDLLAPTARPPMIALDGLGGVGKTALAIKVVRELYDEKVYYFIISLSAKSKLWSGRTDPRKAGFASLDGLLSEIAAVFPDLKPTSDTSRLKRELVELIGEFPGLLLIDNLEDVTDPNVLKFLSLEVPRSTKILITSRRDKDLGALTRSVPELTHDEAALLFESELSRLGYPIPTGQQNYADEILRACGGVPLAIKWAAQIASERRSLPAASGVLKGAGGRKDEFLAFCFANMYDALSDPAKDAARLLPYLGLEWRPHTLSIALDLPLETVTLTMQEISDKGITFYDDNRGYTALPLTKDYLRLRWNEAAHLQKVVGDRFSEMFTSEDNAGILLDWPEERRVAFLREHARGKLESGQYDKALKLVELAQSWKSGEPQLRFLQGKILYKIGRKLPGIEHMRRSLHLENEREKEGGSGERLRDIEKLSGEDLAFYVNALLSHGTRDTENEAIQYVSKAFDRGGVLEIDSLTRTIDCVVQRRDLRMLANLLSRLTHDDELTAAFSRIKHLFSTNSFLIEYETQVAPSLRRLCAIVDLDDDLQRLYGDKLRHIETQHLSQSGGM